MEQSSSPARQIASRQNKLHANDKKSEQILPAGQGPGDVPEMELLSLYATSDLTQMKACIKKAAISYWRSPSYNVTRMLISAGVAFLFGSVFWQQE